MRLSTRQMLSLQRSSPKFAARAAKRKTNDTVGFFSRKIRAVDLVQKFKDEGKEKEIPAAMKQWIRQYNFYMAEIKVGLVNPLRIRT